MRAIGESFRVAGSLRTDGQLFYRGTPQFFIAGVDTFDDGTAPGWSNPVTTTCGNQDYILGGYGKFGKTEVSKTWSGLKDHSLLRLKANFHFIDKWGGETAYMKIDGKYYWTEAFDTYAMRNPGVNVCGAPAAEARMGVPIDITLNHNASDVTVSFGSTLVRSAFEASWGLDDVFVMLK